MVADPLLQIQNLSKKINKRVIVQPFDFQLESGQILALCGGNGAGKSTILRMIAGILQPSTGTVRVQGLEWKRQRKEFASRIGYMPDHFQFGQTLTAWETLCFYAELREVGQDRVNELLRVVGLEDVKHQTVSRYSKGMQQRLLFAQALLSKPDLLLLDEPTNGLDPYWMESFVALLQEIKSAGQSVVFSTHDLQIAEKTADFVVFMHEGQVVGAGSLPFFQDTYGEGGLSKAFAELVSVRHGK